jgi:hypothetical protein
MRGVLMPEREKMVNDLRTICEYEEKSGHQPDTFVCLKGC